MWISIIAWCTRAYSPMWFRKALCVHAALFDTTSQDTSAANTFIWIGTLVVWTASRLILSDRNASSRAIGNRISWATAHNRSQWQCIQNAASLLWWTNVRFGARILATGINTGQLWWTIGIGGTLRLFAIASAFDVRIAGSAWLTIAYGLMAMAFTTGGRSTWISIANGSANAVEAIARFVIATIVVVLTNTTDTWDQWVALRSLRTDAIGMMVLG